MAVGDTRKHLADPGLGRPSSIDVEGSSSLEGMETPGPSPSIRGRRFPDDMMSALRLDRPFCFLGMFSLHLFVAVIGTAVLMEAIWKYIPSHSLIEKATLVDVLNGLVAVVLGYCGHRLSAYHRWQSKASRWTWLAGACWFATAVAGTHPMRVWEISGFGSVFPDYQVFSDWAVYTLPLIRTVLYSVGAFWSSWTMKTDSASRDANQNPGNRAHGVR